MSKKDETNENDKLELTKEQISKLQVCIVAASTKLEAALKCHDAKDYVDDPKEKESHYIANSKIVYTSELEIACKALRDAAKILKMNMQ